MAAVQGGDFDAAYAMGTPSLQEELGNVQRLSAMFANNRPLSWS